MADSEEAAGTSDEVVLRRMRARFKRARDARSEQDKRIVEDLKFSNPAQPEQWQDGDLKARTGRPSLVLDRTNQFIRQVVNDARMNKPAIEVVPVDDLADVKVAESLSGVVRHIEYRSRANIAYDTGIDLSARCGLGWLRVITEGEGDKQEAKILRIRDPLSVLLDPDATEPDGCEAQWGFVEDSMSKQRFEELYPKAQPASWELDGDGWMGEDSIRIVEYFEIEGDKQHWIKATGSAVLERSEFPSRYVPLVPVLGDELWVEGKRYLCGLTRRLMDGQKLHNFQMSAIAEFLASQPKAPFILSAEAVEGHEDAWKKLNGGNPSFLPFNARDGEGEPLPVPSRLAPPPMPGAFAQMATFAVSEMEAAVGMYKANLGQQGNETSGRAINARKLEGDTATFHFIDNLARAIEQLGRVIVDIIPRIYTTRRIQQILGVDGEQRSIEIDPGMGSAVARLDQTGKVLAINPNVGEYDVRVKVGPAFSTQRQEAAQQLSDMIQAQPNLAPILGPMWAKLQDWPGADKVARLLLAMAPPQVQQIEEQGETQIPPQVQAKLQALEQAVEKSTGLIKQLMADRQQLEAEHDLKERELKVKEYEAETDRMKNVPPTPEQMAVIAQQTFMQMLQTPLPTEPEPQPAAMMEPMQ